MATGKDLAGNPKIDRGVRTVGMDSLRGVSCWRRRIGKVKDEGGMMKVE